MTETWKTVPEYEGWYEVSDQGNVRSIERTVQDSLGKHRRMPGKPIRITKKHRHYCVTLSRGRTDCRSVYVHHLVLLAFVGPRPDGQLARHLDDDPANNRLTNLAYGTPSENNFDAVRNGRNSFANRTHCIRGHQFDTASVRGQSRRCAECAHIRRQERRVTEQGDRS